MPKLTMVVDDRPKLVRDPDSDRITMLCEASEFSVSMQNGNDPEKIVLALDLSPLVQNFLWANLDRDAVFAVLHKQDTGAHSEILDEIRRAFLGDDGDDESE